LSNSNVLRPSGRPADRLRDVRLTRHFTRHAEGSVLVEFGDTRVLCTASVDEKVPPTDLENEGPVPLGHPDLGGQHYPPFFLEVRVQNFHRNRQFHTWKILVKKVAKPKS
jgi:hypothetical protein